MKYFRLLISLFLIAGMPFHALAQVVAGFTASATSGCAPLIVTFTNTSTGATSYSWNLGNTNTSFLQNATTSYITPGTYTVTLTATGSAGSNTSTMQIVVNAPPTVSFSATDTTICQGATTAFTSTTNMQSSGAGTYSWNFGDGNTSTIQNPSHPYPTSGYYSITQTATNSNGCSASLVANSYIHVLANPIGQFTASNNNFCGIPAQVTFTDQSTGNSALSHAWSFGDNNTSPAANPVHNYGAGVFSVTEIITDSHGCVDTLSVPNDISVQNVVAAMSAPDTGCANANVNFVNTTLGTNVSSYWLFGDGNTDSNTNTSHIYTSDGTYTVTLVSYINGCNDTATKQIYIRPVPISTFTYTPAHPCPAPVNVQCIPNAPAGSTYTWIFGDGTPTSNLASPVHTYNLDTFTTISMVVNNHGCIYVATDTIKIYSAFVSYSDTPITRDGCAPITTLFNERLLTTTLGLLFPVPYPYPTVSYSYDFGDGSPLSTSTSPTHIYNTQGYYHTSITLTTSNGCNIFDTSSVRAGAKPSLDSVVASNLNTCSSEKTTFQVYAHGAQPLGYEYVLSPPGSAGIGINHTIEQTQFKQPGVYHPYIVVLNYGCPSDTARFTVNITGPEAVDSFHISCTNPLNVDFVSTSVGATSIKRFFGDGDTSTSAHINHTYSAPGNYDVMLTAYNNVTGCRDTTINHLQLTIFKPKIIVPDTALCKYGYLHFASGYNTPNPPPITHKWFINGGQIDTTAQIIYQFPAAGFYSVMLVDEDAVTCLDTTTQTILVAHPIANMTASPTQICAPGSVLFSDSSYYITGTYPVSHAWTFGDGSMITTANNTFSHPYTTAGTFGIEEVVIDNIGCTDTVIKLNYISSHKPVANFAVAASNKCAYDTITFVNTGTPNLQHFYWTFGDGSSSTTASPVHAYSASGSYTVTLAVTDTAGCTDTMVKTGYIGISKPHAAFAEINGSGVCVPLITQFNNLSIRGTTYSWSFGNTNTSVATNPTNSYTTPGNYAVQLITADAHGCKDSATGHVTLYGYSGSFTYSPLAGCPPLNVNFSAAITGIPSITWDFSDGTVTSPSSGTTTSHIYNSPGKYVPKIILVDSSGCHTSSYGTDTIRVDKVHAGFTETSAICVYDTVHFKDTSSGLFFPANSWVWFTGDGGSSVAQNPSHNYRTSGTFSVTLIASDAAGCKDTAVNSITVHPLPTITTTGDTTICPGDSARVGAAGAVSYAWAPAAVTCTSCNPTYITPATQGYYLVTGTDAFGCKNKDSVKITFTYKTVSFAGPGGQICTGQSITLSDSGAQVYNWSPANGLSDSHSPNPIASPTASTTYLAIAKTASCIPDTNFVNVIVNPLPKVTALGGTTVTAGSKVNLQAYGPNIVSFLWDHADLLNCDNCTDPIATMQQTTQFNVTATNQYGCQDSAHVIIDVLCDKSQVFIPNTFTPNGDGQNDVFYPRGIGIKVVKSFRIYNRWGQLVFERDDIQLNDEHSGWDGTFNGAKPVPDTYIYALDAVCDNGSLINWKGDITLIK